VSPSLMPVGINRAGSRGGNASVMVAAESFERVSALDASRPTTLTWRRPSRLPRREDRALEPRNRRSAQPAGGIALIRSVPRAVTYVCRNHARALCARGYGNSPQDRRLQYFEGATLKSRRCSDASVFQSATLIIVTVASPLSMSQIAWLLGYEGSNRGPKTKAIAKAAKGGLQVAFLCIVTRRAIVAKL
jgi:hypothetical protein